MYSFLINTLYLHHLINYFLGLDIKVFYVLKLNSQKFLFLKNQFCFKKYQYFYSSLNLLKIT